MVYKKGHKSGMTGKTHTEATKQKMRIARAKQIFSDETRQKISKSNTGKRASEETRKKQSECNKGENNPHYGIPAWNKGKIGVYTEETKNKMSIAAIGRIKSDEERRKLSIANKGKKLSEEHKKKISDSEKGDKHWAYKKHFTEEHRRKLSESKTGKSIPSLVGHIVTQETRNKISEANSGENAGAWIDGRSFLPYCPKFNERLKELIRERDNRTCQYPGCGLKENGVKLSVHHIHYDKENCAPDLIALCRSCNSKVNINRDYWENFFMDLLKKRGLFYE